MNIKDILVYLDNDKDCAFRIQAAVQLSQFYNAHLTGLYVMRTMNVHPYPYTYLPASAFESFLADANEKKDEAREVFTQKINANGVNGEFRSSDGNLVDTLHINSRYVDLLLIPGSYSSETDINLQYLVSDALMGSTCPVMVLPEAQSLLSQPPQRVMLGWDGSQECSRALRLALPMLEDVESVDVVSISSNEAEAEDIALHITRHGINATVHFVEGSNSDAGRILLEQAEALKSELIVMGAYGHSRLREQILGGATQYMIEHSHLPVLFAH